jgi:hypothetical protein
VRLALHDGRAAEAVGVLSGRTPPMPIVDQ